MKQQETYALLQEMQEARWANTGEADKYSDLKLEIDGHRRVKKETRGSRPNPKCTSVTALLTHRLESRCIYTIQY